MPRTATTCDRKIRVSDFLQKNVTPILQSHPLVNSVEGEPLEASSADDGSALLQGFWRDDHLISIHLKKRDTKRAVLHFALNAGAFVDAPMDAGMLLGAFINHTPFHLSIDEGLIYHCQATLSCDLDITISDAELVKERTREFLQLASDVDWICELYLPQRLGYEGLSTLMETASMTGTSAEDLLDQDQSDGHRPEDGILAESLFTAAKGFNRWKEFLKLARRTAFKIPDTLPPSTLARAWQEVGRWDLARKWSLKMGLSEGRYPKAPWLCPCYLRALIETGDDIEALRLLMQHEDGEPGFYSLLRGRALRSAGDHTGAKEAFDHYDMNWPGDILGQSEISALND